METRIYEREKLYKEVWAEPMTTVAKRYGISDVALRKHCRKLQIPLPANGHWAKVKAGQKIKIPALPKTKGPEKIVVTNQANESIGKKNSDRLSFLPEEKREAIIEYCSSLTVPDELIKPHDLIKDTIQYFRSRKESTKPPVNRVINIRVSEEQKERVYRIFNTLFFAFEHFGYKIEIKAPKSQHYRNYTPRVYDNEVYVCLGQDGVPIIIKEKQKRVEHIPTKEEIEKQRKGYMYIPPYDIVNYGKLDFEIDAYHLKRKNWHDRDNKKLEDEIGEIVIWVIEAIEVAKEKRLEFEERDRRWKEERLIQQQIAERKERELERLKLLEQCVSDWDKAEKIRSFASCIEFRLPGIKDKEKKEKIKKWLRWAREKADWLDPLTDKRDIALGKGKHLFDLINDID